MTAERPIINYRQKALVGLLSALGGSAGNTDFQKYLFLYAQEFEDTPSFEFVPYKYGCFSFQSYADKRRLIEIGALEDTADWKLSSDFLVQPDDNSKFDEFVATRGKLKGDRLIKYVYKMYPYYAINSEIAEEKLTTEELKMVDSSRPSFDQPCFFTIGYEGSSFEGYLNRLLQNGVHMLIDVRRNPLSRKYGFSKKTLSETVEKLGIKYLHIPELGIASEKRRELITQSDYDQLFDEYECQELIDNKASIRRIANLMKQHHRIAITCFEAHVCMCHRGRVANALSELADWDYDIRHI